MEAIAFVSGAADEISEWVSTATPRPWVRAQNDLEWESTSPPLVRVTEVGSLSLGDLLSALSETDPEAANAVDSSRKMLDLPDDWDGDGSPCYSEATWGRAVGFVARNALWLWQKQGLRMECPAIRKGPEGSIDLHWKSTDRELLVNIPVDDSVRAAFYGDDRQGLYIEGAIDVSIFNQGLLLWLTRK